MAIKTCLRCGHVWIDQTKNPRACPQCGSYAWDKGQRLGCAGYIGLFLLLGVAWRLTMLGVFGGSWELGILPPPQSLYPSLSRYLALPMTLLCTWWIGRRVSRARRAAAAMKR